MKSKEEKSFFPNLNFKFRKLKLPNLDTIPVPKQTNIYIYKKSFILIECMISKYYITLQNTVTRNKNQK